MTRRGRVALIAVAGLVGCSAAVDPTSTERASAALFDALESDGPGCTAAVGRDGEVVWADAFGAASLETGEPMTPETIVDIGSTSKQFTATAIALLVEGGTIDLDDTLATYVDGLPDWSEDVTVDQLVHHTSGIPDYIDLLIDAGFDYSDPSDADDASAVLAEATELAFEPGTRFDYSNSNYFLLGEVVESASGQGLDEYLAETVFEPLDLAMVMDPGSSPAGTATSYEAADDGWEIADSPWTQLGDGGIQTTPSELVRWGEQYWAPTIGGPDITELRFASAVESDSSSAPTRYGFGIEEFEVDGRRLLSHSGSWAGFDTSFTVDPEGQLVVAVTCSAEEISTELAPDDDLDLRLLDLWRSG